MAKGELSVVKAKGEENVADGLTKHGMWTGRRWSSTWRCAAWHGGVVATSFVHDWEMVAECRTECA